MKQVDLLETVRAKLPERAYVTTTWIMQRYHVLPAQAVKVVDDLQAEGLVGQEWNIYLGGFPVIKEQG